MNIHHLELFYQVATHGGISEAVRKIPYGIQQPAVSGQIIQLEESLGVTLFRRRPFELTAAGRELFEFIKPFFDNVPVVAEKLRGGQARHIRIGASEIVLRDHLPPILQSMRGEFPQLKVTLREGHQPELARWIMEQQIDLAITMVLGKPPAGVTFLKLCELPLTLLVPSKSKLESAEQLWAEDRIEETLISMPTNEPVYRCFQMGLAKRKVDWFTGIEVSSPDLVETYVASGYGIGLTVGVPGAGHNPQVRRIPLDDFEMMDFGVMWHGKATPVMQACVDRLEETARSLFS